MEEEAARKAREEQETKARQAREEQETKARHARVAQERMDRQQREAYAAQFRKKVAVGDETHCGMVIERKDPIVKIQTVAGEKWLRIDKVYPPGTHSCRFYNGQYID